MGQKSHKQIALPFDMIKQITVQMLKGVNYLHKKGIMHRNLKPENILLDTEKDNSTLNVKIGDMSSSRALTYPHMDSYTPEDPKDRDRSGREARRLWYRAPEFFFRKRVYSQEVDMWSLGCLLAEMARGEPLFVGESEIE